MERFFRWARKALYNSLLILLVLRVVLLRPQFQLPRMIGKLILLPRSFCENKLLMKIESWNRLPRPFRDRTINVCFHKRFLALPRTWVSLPRAQLSFIPDFLTWRFLTVLRWHEPDPSLKPGVTNMSGKESDFTSSKVFKFQKQTLVTSRIWRSYRELSMAETKADFDEGPTFFLWLTALAPTLQPSHCAEVKRRWKAWNVEVFTVLSCGSFVSDFLLFSLILPIYILLLWVICCVFPAIGFLFWEDRKVCGPVQAMNLITNLPFACFSGKPLSLRAVTAQTVLMQLHSTCAFRPRPISETVSIAMSQQFVPLVSLSHWRAAPELNMVCAKICLTKWTPSRAPVNGPQTICLLGHLQLWRPPKWLQKLSAVLLFKRPSRCQKWWSNWSLAYGCHNMVPYGATCSSDEKNMSLSRPNVNMSGSLRGCVLTAQ